VQTDNSKVSSLVNAFKLWTVAQKPYVLASVRSCGVPPQSLELHVSPLTHVFPLPPRYHHSISPLFTMAGYVTILGAEAVAGSGAPCDKLPAALLSPHSHLRCSYLCSVLTFHSWIYHENRVPHYQRLHQKHDGLRVWQKVRALLIQELGGIYGHNRSGRLAIPNKTWQLNYETDYTWLLLTIINK